MAQVKAISQRNDTVVLFRGINSYALETFKAEGKTYLGQMGVAGHSSPRACPLGVS